MIIWDSNENFVNNGDQTCKDLKVKKFFAVVPYFRLFGYLSFIFPIFWGKDLTGSCFRHSLIFYLRPDRILRADVEDRDNSRITEGTSKGNWWVAETGANEC